MTVSTKLLWCLTSGAVVACWTYLPYRIGSDVAYRDALPALARERQRGDDYKAELAELRRTLHSEPRAEDEYVLWEVHDVQIDHDPRDPKQDGDLPALCKSIGDPSMLRLQADLAAYSLWSDRLGQQKLGCRWVRKRGAP